MATYDENKLRWTIIDQTHIEKKINKQVDKHPCRFEFSLQRLRESGEQENHNEKEK
jgi:hypothetical protein